jgi:hypothetical protein
MKEKDENGPEENGATQTHLKRRGRGGEGRGRRCIEAWLLTITMA